MTNRRINVISRPIPAAAAAACAALVGVANAEPEFRFIARSGAPAPGGGVFADFQVPSISAPGAGGRGQVAFTGGALDGAHVRGVWWHDGVSLAAIAREGEAAPGLQGIPGLGSVPFQRFGDAIISQTGAVGFTADLDAASLPGGIFPQAVYQGPTLSLVAVNTGDAPGFNPPQLYYGIESTALDLVNRRLLTAGDSLGFYAKVQDAEGGVGGPTFPALMRASSPTSGGPMLFPAPESTMITAMNSTFAAAWYSPGQLSTTSGLGIGVGTPAPGGGNFTDVDFAPTLNNAGHAAFYAKTSASGGGGIWRWTGTLQAVALGGQAAPGTTETIEIVDPECLMSIDPFVECPAIPVDVTAHFSGFGDPAMNGDDKIVFAAYLSGDAVHTNDDFAIYSKTTGGTLALIAREGGNAPGGGVFARTGDASPFLDPHINGNGDVAFQGWIDGATKGIWAVNNGGTLRLIARDGQTVLIDGVGEKTLQNIQLGVQARSANGFSHHLNSGNEDGRASFFNDAGEIVFRATIDGETWILVGRHVSVCPTDLNGDGVTDSVDLDILNANWGACSSSECPGDINRDGFVDGFDLITLLSNFGPCPN